MDAFQAIALLLTAVWFLGVVAFRRSRLMLLGGMAVIVLYTIAAVLLGAAVPEEIGLSGIISWQQTALFALGGLLVSVGYSPLADKIASRWFPEPPRLDAFKAIQKSRFNLVLGVAAAWLLGGILEEIIARGIVLASLHSWLSTLVPAVAAAAVAIVVAASGAGLAHLYQGKRAVVIVTQISIIFGIVFVLSGYNLLAVIICHGLYDTIAFVRFANRQSRYSAGTEKKEL